MKPKEEAFRQRADQQPNNQHETEYVESCPSNSEQELPPNQVQWSSLPRFMTQPHPYPDCEPAVPKTAIIDEPNGEFYKFRRPYGMSNFDFEYECSLRITKMRLAIRRSIKKLYEDDFRTFVVAGELIGLNAEIVSALSQFAMDGHNIEIVTEPDDEQKGHRVTILGIF